MGRMGMGWMSRSRKPQFSNASFFEPPLRVFALCVGRFLCFYSHHLLLGEQTSHSHACIPFLQTDGRTCEREAEREAVFSVSHLKVYKKRITCRVPALRRTSKGQIMTLRKELTGHTFELCDYRRRCWLANGCSCSFV